MPRERIAREKATFNGIVTRSFVIAAHSIVGGMITGAIFSVAAIINPYVQSPQAYTHIPATAALFYGAIIGAIVGIVLSPIPIITLIRTEYVRSIKATFYCAAVASLAAVIHPSIGFLGCLAVFVGACIYARCVSPIVWPNPLPPGRCIGCGYDLKGIDADHCPECGKYRPGPRECRVCLNPLPPIDPGNRSLITSPVVCDNCRQNLGPDMTCQRCGTPLYASDATCQGCDHPFARMIIEKA